MEIDPLPPPSAGLGRTILGVWNLVSRVDVDAAGNRRIDPALGPDPVGLLCFAPRHFAVQYMKRDRTASGAAPAPIQGKNNSLTVDGYDAYFGTYQLDEIAGTLTTRIEGSVAPANIGSTFVRQMRVIEGQLVIRLGTTAADGTPLTRTLRFTRLG